jgi:glycosyltransferase involved in cell wall biosynthesis
MAVPTVGLFRAPADFTSFSMDRYATSLIDALDAFEGERLDIREFRPNLARTAHRLLGRTPLFRYWVRYPRYLLAARSTRFAVNHVVDHAYGHLAYALDPRRTIVTCHDLFPLMYWRGEIAGLPRRRKRPLTVEFSVRALRRARFVVVVSMATKRDLVRVIGVNSEAIHVVPPGVDAMFQPLDVDARRTATDLWPIGGIGTKRILSIDTGNPYKNASATLETFARVQKTVSADIRLIRVGRPLPEAQQALARRLGIEDAIVQLQGVPESEMPLLYNSCDLLLFPSFYEGFGWPPLEAMACGLPVVASRAAALQEVIGDVSPMADARDHDALAEHASRLLEDDREADATRSRGLVRAKEFSWERTARLVAALYRTILEQPQ